MFNYIVDKNMFLSTGEIKVIDDRNDGGYVTPIEAEGKNETFISRIRKDNSKKNAINMFSP